MSWSAATFTSSNTPSASVFARSIVNVFFCDVGVLVPLVAADFGFGAARVAGAGEAICFDGADGWDAAGEDRREHRLKEEGVQVCFPQY